MNPLLQIFLGFLIALLLALTIWAIRDPERVKRKKWMAPLVFYLSNLSLRRWTVNLLGAGLILWFANFYIHWIQPALTPADLFPPEFTGPVAVKAWKADTGPVVNVATYTGRIEPFLSNEVYARVDGFVEKMYVYEGDYVEKGKLLAKLDLSNIRPQLLKAVADSTYLHSELERMQKLFENSAVTASQLDKTRKMYQQAVAQVELMRTRTVYADIRAGISGFIAERRVYPGQYVKRGERLFRIDQLDRVRIKFKVSEQDLPFFHPDDPVLLEFPQFSMPVFERFEAWRHRIQFISTDRHFELFANGAFKNKNSNDNEPVDAWRSPTLLANIAVVYPAEDPVTRAGTVEVRLSNPNYLLKTNGYVVGKFAVARVDSALRVPSKAIVRTPDHRTVVFVAPAMTDQGFADIRDIRVGLQSPIYSQVLSGLKPGEYVVYAGMKDLVKGQSIQILERKE